MLSHQPEHDAGGKVKLALLRGCRGDATFVGSRREFRPLLIRDWVPNPYKLWLWVGMNPSTASHLVDDPTIRKELMYTIKHGGRGYRKCNVADYRATKPAMLTQAPAMRSQENLDIIFGMAKAADVIVCAWGAIPKFLVPYEKETLAVLLTVGKRLYCLGKTAGGKPRHPLYVASATELEHFAGP